MIIGKIHIFNDVFIDGAGIGRDTVINSGCVVKIRSEVLP